jgi:hypothetical protein
MPWTKDNPPTVAKKWPADAQALGIRVANAVLSAGHSEKDAIFACIGAVKSAYPLVVGKGKANSEFVLSFGEGAESALAVTTRVFDISAIELKEGSNGRKLSDIQVLPEGKFKHPWYGDLDFTAPVLRQAKRNFDSNVLGTDIMVDEGHDRGKALGWYKELHYGKRTIGEGDAAKEYSGLWGVIEWTELGEELLTKQLYKYFSAEVGSWTGPTGDKVPNVLLGGGLTNRPFFKQMPAVKLSEGQVTDRLVIGLFADEAWAFMAGTPEEEEEEEGSFNRAFLFALGEDDEEDEEEEEEEDKAMDELLKAINEKYVKKFTTAAQVLEFLGTLNQPQTGELAEFTDKFRTTFGALGLEFKDGEDAVAVVAKAFKAATDTSATLSTRVVAIEGRLQDQEFEAAFASQLRAGKVIPAQKEKMAKLFKTDHQLFTELMEVTEARQKFDEFDMGEERGSIGDSGEPGHDGQFADMNSPEAKAEAQRYAKMEQGRQIQVPGLAAARNGSQKEG